MIDVTCSVAHSSTSTSGSQLAIRVVSSAFVRITGLERGQLAAKDVLQLASQSDRARVLSASSASRWRSASLCLLAFSALTLTSLGRVTEREKD